MAGRTIPSIMTDVQKIKLARADNDKVGEDLARETLRTKLAQMEAEQYEKQYGTVSGELKKAHSDLRTAQQKIDAFKYQSDVDVAKIEGRFDVKQARVTERVKGRQERKTKIALQDDAQAWEKEFADYRANRALALAEQYGLSKQTQTDIIRALGGTDPQQEAVAIYEATIRDGDKGRDFWRAYNKIGERSGGGSDWEPPSLTQTQSNEIALNALAPLDRLPVRIVDVEAWNEGMPFVGSDTVEGQPATDADYEAMSREVMTATIEAAKQGLSPNLMKSVIDNLRASAHNTLNQYSDYLDEVDGGIVFNDNAAKNLSQEEDLRNIVMQIKQAIQINDFFESAPGKKYYNWVNESVDHAYRQGRSAWLRPQSEEQSLLPTQTPSPTSTAQPGQPGTETTQPEAKPEQPASDGSSRLPSVERENVDVQTQTTNLSKALDAQGWEVGDILTYTGEKNLKLKYAIIFPRQKFRIVGISSKSEGYPYDGILIKLGDHTNPILRSAGPKISVPMSVWTHFIRSE
jgi:hypothetical protein